MKRLIVPIIVITALLVGLFVIFHLDGQESTGRYEVYQTEDLRIMDLPRERIDYSPIMSAVFYTHLREGNLPLSFSLSFINPGPLEESDTVYCVVSHKGVDMISPLKVDSVEQNDGHFLYRTHFEYNMADLLKEKDESEVMDMMKSFPADLRSVVKYIGKDVTAYQQSSLIL